MSKHTQNPDLFTDYTCYIWNIKILDVISGIYTDLFPFAYEQGGIKVKGRKEIRVKSIGQIEDLIMGELVLCPQDRSLEVFNAKKNEVEQASIGEDIYPFPKVARFFFIPSAHRLCVEQGTGISTSDTQVYLERLLASYIKARGLKGDSIPKVEIEKTPSDIDKILSWNDIWEIEVRISFTNDDMTYDYEKLLDDDMKKARATDLRLKATAETSVPLSPQGTILQGAIEMAKSNGELFALRGPSRKKAKMYRSKESIRVEHFTEGVAELPFAVRRFVLKVLKGKEDGDTNTTLRNEGDDPSNQRDQMES